MMLKPSPKLVITRFLIFVILTAALMGPPSAMALPQGASVEQGKITILGTVCDSAGVPVNSASVTLEGKGQKLAELKTNSEGKFFFLVPEVGTYTVRVEKPGFRTEIADSLVLSTAEQKLLSLVLNKLDASPGALAFDEKPSFTIAGITDWSGAGGHGSDTSLRTSEALAKEIHALQTNRAEGQSSVAGTNHSPPNDSESKLRGTLDQDPRSFDANRQLGEFYFHSKKYREAIPLFEAAYRINPGDHDNAYDLALAYKGSGDYPRAKEQAGRLLLQVDKAELRLLLGDLDELLNDPLAAVREYERAAKLEPSEPNYFAWGTELLLHKGVQPAVEVFSKGSAAHPESARMLAGLGAALYASGSYDEAARKLCDAADRNSADPAAYFFMGKMQKGAAGALPCVEQKLAQFVQLQPANALAHYYYAVALWKRERESPNSLASFEQIQAVLQRALSIDPKLGEAYLQLGIMYSQRGSTQQAIAAYQRAIEANMNLGEAHYRLAQAYKIIGEQSKAQPEFQRYEQIAKTEAAEVERERRELRQFLVILKEQPGRH
jgi:tetratricopeptide (TPR) repeat protein